MEKTTTKKYSSSAKNAMVPFDWTTDAIEKISVSPPVAPHVKFANTSLESIIARVGQRKKEEIERIKKYEKRVSKLIVRKPTISTNGLKDLDFTDQSDALNEYFR